MDTPAAKSIDKVRSYSGLLFLYVMTVAACVSFGVWIAIPEVSLAAVVILTLTAGSVVHWKSSHQLVAALTGIGAFAFGSVFAPPPHPAVYWVAIVFTAALAQWITTLNVRRDRRIGAGTARLTALAESYQRDLFSIAHDLRNPIAFISGVAGLLDNGGLTSEESGQALARLEIAARSMDLLVSNLVDLGNLRDGRLAPRPRIANLASLITEVVGENSRRAIAQKITLDVDAADLHQVLCDPLHLERILRNLIGVGIERSPQGGAVRVVSTAAGNRVRVEITDSGPAPDLGILATVADSAREPNLEARGVELGLFIAARLAEANHSRVELSGGNTGGLTISLDMPDGSRSE